MGIYPRRQRPLVQGFCEMHLDRTFISSCRTVIITQDLSDLTSVIYSVPLGETMEDYSDLAGGVKDSGKS